VGKMRISLIVQNYMERAAYKKSVNTKKKPKKRTNREIR
jgi:hypothetical protein